MARSSMGRRPIRGWAQQDAFTAWRKVLCYMTRPGVRASIKAAANRHERRNLNIWDGWE